MGKHRILLSLVLAAACACGPAPEREWTYNRCPIINGEPDTSQEHMAVVAVTGNYSMCTGTLIAPQVVLTAGHCVSSGTMRVGFGNTVNWGMTWRTVTQKEVHPDFSASSTSIVNDIAMVKFSGSAPSGVVPIPHLPHSLGVTTADIGTQLVYVGFGQTSVNNSGSSGTKMRMSNDLKWVCTSSYGCGYPAGYNTICQDQTPSGICSGDSGGPAFIFRNGREYVAGVGSYTGQNCAQFGCSTKVDEYEEFINGLAGGYPGAPCSSAAQCTSGFCVDGVCCQSDCSGVCRACNLAGSLGTCSNVQDGTLCPDGDRCNGDEKCQQGLCAPAVQPLDCDDHTVCTLDSCDPGGGCEHETVECDDSNLCTLDSCDPVSGCQHDALPDGTGCGGGLCGPALCLDGKCVAQDPQACDDNDPCTEDWCDPETGCVFDPLPDGYECGDCMMCMGSECVEIEDCGPNGCGCDGLYRRQGTWPLAILVLLPFRRRLYGLKTI